jgi:hypothetical protein
MEKILVEVRDERRASRVVPHFLRVRVARRGDGCRPSELCGSCDHQDD